MKKTLFIATALVFTGASSVIAQESAVTYQYRIPVGGLVVHSEAPAPSPAPVSLLLRSATLEPATVGQPYSFDFKSLLELSGGNPTPPMSAVSWGASASLPSWLTLNPHTGVLGGTPVAKNEEGTDFEIIATHEDAEGAQVFTLVVNGAVLKAKQIATRGDTTCAVTVGGAAVCWGAGSNGQIGDGFTSARATPTAVAGLENGVTHVAVGQFHACALTTNGNAFCWGNNNNGQLGDGTGMQKKTPSLVTSLAGSVERLVAGHSHTCALTTGKQVYCWGLNTSGELGDGTLTGKKVPVAVEAIGGSVSDIVAGHNHTCALLLTGGVKCWGYNAAGGLGNGFKVNSTMPVAVVGLTKPVLRLAAGSLHTCAAVSPGGIVCWGGNSDGQLGDGTRTDKTTPTPVSDFSDEAIALTAGYAHTCAVTAEGVVKCWGHNGTGQYGDGTTSGKNTPATSSGPAEGVSQIFAGMQHTCAISTTNRTLCWGLNASGQLGDATTIRRLKPVEVLP